MKSIQGRLLRAFLMIIAVLSVYAIALSFINQNVTKQYKEISDVMIAEYQLVKDASILIEGFNVEMQSVGTDSRDSQMQMQRAKESIEATTEFLDIHINDTLSLSNYVGFKSSVDNLIFQIDESLRRFNEDSIETYSEDYNEANKLYGFVRENGSTLIYGQLEYSSSLRNAINKTYALTALLTFALLALLIVGCIWEVLRFSKRFTKPLVSLTVASRALESASVHFKLDKELLTQEDEIGALARSFNSMTQALRNKIAELDASNVKMAKVTQDVSNKNQQLENLNKFMVNRELKMVELKKEIAELKLTNTTQKNTH